MADFNQSPAGQTSVSLPSNLIGDFSVRTDAVGLVPNAIAFQFLQNPVAQATLELPIGYIPDYLQIDDLYDVIITSPQIGDEIAFNGNNWVNAPPFAGQYEFVGVACSDETTALTAGTAKITFRMPFAMSVSAVQSSVTTAPTGSTLIVDINKSGASILGTKLSIDATEKTSTTAASAATITDSNIADDAEITIDIDQIGATVAGAGLKVWIVGTAA